MSDDRQLSGPDPSADDFSRRDFVAMSMAAGVAAAATTSAPAANLPVTETNVRSKRPTARATPRSFIRRPARIPAC